MLCHHLLLHSLPFGRIEGSFSLELTEARALRLVEEHLVLRQAALHLVRCTHNIRVNFSRQNRNVILSAILRVKQMGQGAVEITRGKLTIAAADGMLL